MSTYAPKPWEIAGFELYGERQDNGSIKLGTHDPASQLPDQRTQVPAFPEKVEVVGVVYTLEFVKENNWGGRKRVEKNDPANPLLRICWGVYV